MGFQSLFFDRHVHKCFDLLQIAGSKSDIYKIPIDCKLYSFSNEKQLDLVKLLNLMSKLLRLCVNQ